MQQIPSFNDLLRIQQLLKLGSDGWLVCNQIVRIHLLLLDLLLSRCRLRRLTFCGDFIPHVIGEQEDPCDPKHNGADHTKRGLEIKLKLDHEHVA
ncbi:hypothetical protein D9M71_833440 [compost metagenome]